MGLIVFRNWEISEYPVDLVSSEPSWKLGRLVTGVVNGEIENLAMVALRRDLEKNISSFKYLNVFSSNLKYLPSQNRNLKHIQNFVVD